MKEGQKKIFNSLTLNPEGLSFSELLKKTDLSNTALSNYLKGMNESGLIIKDYKRRKYHLPTTYLPMEFFDNEWQEFMKGSVAQFINLGLKISKIKNSVNRKEALQSYLQGSFLLLTLFLWQIVGESTRNIKTIKDLKNQDLMLEKSRIINEEIQNWVIGIIDSLATSILLNADMLNEAGEPVYQEILHHAKQNMKKLENILNLKRLKGESIDERNGGSNNEQQGFN